MGKLALGISLICLLYIFLAYILLIWHSHLWDDEELSRQWSGVKRRIRIRIKKLLNLRLKDNTRDLAK